MSLVGFPPGPQDASHKFEDLFGDSLLSECNNAGKVTGILGPGG